MAAINLTELKSNAGEARHKSCRYGYIRLGPGSLACSLRACNDSLEVWRVVTQQVGSGI